MKVVDRKNSLSHGALLLRWILLGVVWVATLFAILDIWEDWQGKRAWDSYKLRLPEAPQSNPVPPEQENFAQAPIVQKLLWARQNPASPEGQLIQLPLHLKKKLRGDWTEQKFTDFTVWATLWGQPAGANPAKSILTALKPYQEIFSQLEEASKRPSCQFPRDNRINPAITVQKLSILLNLRASAFLTIGDHRSAYSDVLTNLRLVKTYRSDPHIFPFLVQLSVLRDTFQPIWEGLARKAWTEQELAGLQAELEQIQLFNDFAVVTETERSLANDLFSALLAGDYTTHDFETFFHQTLWASQFWPMGWIYRNQILINRYYRETVPAGVDVARHRIDPAQVEKAYEAWDRIPIRPQTVLGKMASMNSYGLSRKLACVETGRLQAVLSCALEQYRIKNRRYPQSLGQLAPRYIDSIPLAITTGQEIQYSVSSREIVLTACGWQVFGGVTIESHSDSIRSQADWVWRYPQKGSR